MASNFLWKDAAEFARLPAMSLLREVVVYSRKGCHLCEIVKETLSKLERRGGFRWREVDVETDDGLRRQFTDEVPVVFIDGRKAFKYRPQRRTSFSGAVPDDEVPTSISRSIVEHVLGDEVEGEFLGDRGGTEQAGVQVLVDQVT